MFYITLYNAKNCRACTIHNNTYQDTCQYLYAGRKPVCWTNPVLVCIWHVLWYVLVCIGMYLVCNCMYWISVQHTVFRPACKYWHVFWYVLICIRLVLGMYSNTTRVDPNVEAILFWVLWYVLVCFDCIGLYEHMFACIGSQIDCKHSHLVPYCTWIHFSCNIYCWYRRNDFAEYLILT